MYKTANIKQIENGYIVSETSIEIDMENRKEIFCKDLDEVYDEIYNIFNQE